MDRGVLYTEWRLIIHVLPPRGITECFLTGPKTTWPQSLELVRRALSGTPGGPRTPQWREIGKLPESFDGDPSRFREWRAACERWVDNNSATSPVPAKVAVNMILATLTSVAGKWAVRHKAAEFLTFEFDLLTGTDTTTLDPILSAAALFGEIKDDFEDFAASRAHALLSCISQGMERAGAFLVRFCGACDDAKYRLDDPMVIDWFINATSPGVRQTLKDEFEMEQFPNFVAFRLRFCRLDAARPPERAGSTRYDNFRGRSGAPAVSARAGRAGEFPTPSRGPPCPQLQFGQPDAQGNVVPPTFRGMLSEHEGLREHVAAAGRCLRCRRPGAPHTSPERWETRGVAPVPRPQ